MSDLPVKQVDHPAHNMPTATEHYSGHIPDFRNKIGFSDLTPGRGPNQSVDLSPRSPNKSGEAGY
jgi:hypothetical protein